MKAVTSQVDEGLPLRLSARLNDPHFDARATALSDRIDIILDGTVLEHATSYDIVTGEVVRHRRGKDGRLVLGEDRAPTFETLRGHVEVRWVRSSEAPQ